MIEAAKKTTKKEGGKTTRYGLQWNYTNYQEFSPLVWTLGGNYADWKTLSTRSTTRCSKSTRCSTSGPSKDKFLITKEATTNLMGPGGRRSRSAPGVAAMYHRAAYDAA